MTKSWLEILRAHVEKRPAAILNLSEAEWNFLTESRRGVSKFTKALPHAQCSKLRPPTVCLLLAEAEGEHRALLGLVESCRAATTLQSRVKVKHAVKITPASPDALVSLIASPTFERMLRDRLAKKTEMTVLSPKLSAHLIQRLALVETNAEPMQVLTESLAARSAFRGNQALQEDAIRIALKAFGLELDDSAISRQLMPNRETALARVPITEDGVIEYDTRIVPGYELASSDLTGWAVFKRGRERLEVFTANRRQLERAFGVDLIYLNVTRQNIVMLQYKMLEPSGANGEDWIFTPDSQLDKELERMRKYAVAHTRRPTEYRLNAATFYLKFVKRDGALRHSGIIMPIDHYDCFVQDPASRGSRGGLRISYDALEGRYMREQPFLDLIRAGYIGAYAQTTEHFMTLVNGVLDRGRAVVAAIQIATDEGHAVSYGDNAIEHWD